MSDQDRAGARIASIRKMRGLTGRELADRAHVSYSLLGKVESGAVPASPALIGAVARALRVDVPRITGQPYEERPGSHQAPLHTMIVAIRRSVDTYDLPDENITPRSSEAMASDVRQISAWGQEAKFTQIAGELPGLLDELITAVHTSTGPDRKAKFALLAEAYSGASIIANLLGYLDLRSQIVERIRWASELSGDPLRVQRVRWQRTHSLMAAGGYAPALKLMEQVRSDLGDDISAMNGPTLSVYGSSHLRSALLFARSAKINGAGSAQDAWAHMAAARQVADRMGADRNDYGLAFGPSNVSQHEVAIAVELEDGAEAVRRSREMRLGAGVPAVRRGHHYIDLARGYALAEDYTGSLKCLKEARRIAPQQTRLHPSARETVLSIASARRGREELSLLASWMGVSV
jgi:transcriptional regulator with XRE-family HTH domain